MKRYSSGMYVRLAFAVAAHLEPEILVIDEVLAVGDAEFQKKCLGKMDEVSRRQGRTVLFVSHNMGVLASLCPTAVWLEGGSIQNRGSSKDIIAEYMARRTPNIYQTIQLRDINRPSIVQEDRLRFQSLEWLCNLPLQHGEPVKARIWFKTRAPVSDVTVGIGFSSFDGRRLLTYDTDFQEGFRASISRPGWHSIDFEIDSLPLAPDIYGLDIGCRSSDFHLLDYLPAVAEFEVVAGPKTPGAIIRKNGGVHLESKWSWKLDIESNRSGIRV